MAAIVLPVGSEAQDHRGLEHTLQGCFDAAYKKDVASAR